MIYWIERSMGLPIVFRVWMIEVPSTRESNIPITASLMGNPVCEDALLNDCYLVERSLIESILTER